MPGKPGEISHGKKYTARWLENHENYDTFQPHGKSYHPGQNWGPKKKKLNLKLTRFFAPNPYAEKTTNVDVCLSQTLHVGNIYPVYVNYLHGVRGYV